MTHASQPRTDEIEVVVRKLFDEMRQQAEQFGWAGRFSDYEARSGEDKRFMHSVLMSLVLHGAIYLPSQFAVGDEILRKVLKLLCLQRGISLVSNSDPQKPARNYELALRLGIGEVFGLTEDDVPSN